MYYFLLYNNYYLTYTRQLLGARYAEFERFSTVEKTSYVLGSKNWEDNFDILVKEFI